MKAHDCNLDAPAALPPATGSASGGPEVWNVSAWGDVRECRDIATILEEVREALELGCRTVNIERQGAPTASPNVEATHGGTPLSLPDC